MVSYQKPSYELQQTLQEIKKLKRDVKPYGTPDFASSWALRSIQNYESDLQEELNAAKLLESKYSAKLSVTGNPVRDHGIDSAFFGKLLVYVQDFVNHLAFSQTNKSRTKLIERNKLELLHVGAGSFEAMFVSPKVKEDEVGILVEEDGTPIKVEPVHIGLHLLNQFLDGSIDIDTSAEILQDKHVKLRYQKIISLIADEGASVSLRTRENPYAVTLTASQARDRKTWIDLLQSEEEDATVVGEITLIDLKTGHFAINPEGGERFTGRSSGRVKDKFRGIPMGAQVTATLHVTSVSHDDIKFKPRKYYVLKDIHANPTLLDFMTTEVNDPSIVKP